MSTINHNLLTSENLHEPKGVDTADIDKVYISDGAGSGSWLRYTTMGWEDYQHAGADQTGLASGVPTVVANDGAGVYSNTVGALPGSTGIWDTATSSFDFAAGNCKLGDTIDLRVDLTYTVSTNNDNMKLELKLAVGDPAEFSVTIDERNIDTAGSQSVMRFISFYIGSNAVLNNPGQITITPDSAGDDISVNGWYIRTIPLVPVAT